MGIRGKYRNDLNRAGAFVLYSMRPHHLGRVEDQDSGKIIALEKAYTAQPD